MELVIVNDKDEIIGYKDRGDANDNDITRVSALWIYNSKNEVLIAQRVFTKLYSPGCWQPAVAGTVEKGETYLDNVIKETKEELGIEIMPEQLRKGIYKYNDTSHKYFSQSYVVKLDLPIDAFEIEKSEVENIRWINLSDLYSWLETHPEDFVTMFKDSLDDHSKLMHQ